MSAFRGAGPPAGCERVVLAGGGVLDTTVIPSGGPVAAYNMVWTGALWEAVRNASVFKDLSAVAIGSIVTVWTPASGKKFRLMGGSISVSAAVSVLFEDNAAGAGNFIYRSPKLLADTPYTFVVGGGNGYLSAAINQLLKATSSGAANVTGTLWGCEE